MLFHRLLLKNEYIALPTIGTQSQRNFLKIGISQKSIWAIDGKQIREVCQAHSGYKYYKYRQYFSISLQAVVDATGN